jgi:spore coat protein CotH
MLRDALLRMTTSVACVALASSLFASPAHAQTADDLFDGSAVQGIHVTMHWRDWDALRANFTSNDFYPADVTWNGVRVRNVGVRSRGLGSRSGIKPGLELNFAHYSSRGEFFGLRSLVLDNLTTDPSMIRERVAFAFMRRVGVPAPREAHAQLFVNDQSVGLYTIVEPVDTTFVQRVLGNSNGVLFEYHWVEAFYATFPGDNLDVYRPLFEARSPELRSTFDLYDPIRELFRRINDAPADQFRDAVGAQLDLDASMRLIAAETVIAEWDGLLGYAGMNNFYLYRDAVSGQSRLLPWDADHSLHSATSPLLAGANENVLMRRALQDPVLRNRFFTYATDALRAASNDNWLAREIAGQSRQIREAALADSLKPYSNEEFDAALKELAAFAQSRTTFVAAQIQQLR